ncbi:hypothetical protein [Cellulomonas biazotea]|uniref:TFIIS-type domain-containing protein n=1 Tax=Cellulomonas biazotea TaxID=1709 RepID=A0A402DVF0_9CELL|nr:hypothetical protein [Cellulomonas biazotea]GCE78104.1 hypothetical protein CBZ_31600 [Cellulomonas biazotea]
MARRRGDAARARDARPPEPLGSVSQPSGPVVPGTEACAHCGSTELTRIRMTLSSGRPAVFVSCAACERTGWFALDGDGEPLGRDEVVGGDGSA